MRIDELETPALTSDLDADRNVAAMQGYCDEHGLALRPNVKRTSSRRWQACRSTQACAGSPAIDPAVGVTGHGHLLEHPEAAIYELHEEHGFVDVGACERPSGRRARHYRPHHACATANVYDQVVVHRDEFVAILPTVARGKVR
jgi:D-serine deaminase-like pyridoxal phosphate-dependent protein